MPVLTTYPGVYIEELSSGVHTITGVATSIAAFVGYTQRGLDNRAKRILSFADFERAFGGLAADSELSYAVQQFFTNGGNTAYVVRVPKNDSVLGSLTLRDKTSGGTAVLRVDALSKGAWANNLFIDIDSDGVPAADTKTFNLTVTDSDTGIVETFRNVTMDNTKSNFVERVINDLDHGSKLISVTEINPGSDPDRPAETGTISEPIDLSQFSDATKDYTIKISSDLPTGKISDQPVTVVAAHESVPGSLLGICRLLESKANLALAKILPGARIRCSPAGSSAANQRIRVRAFFDSAQVPDSLDAQITFSAGTPDDADAALNLVSGNVNMGQYWLGTNRAAPVFAIQAVTAGEDGTKLPISNDLIGDPLKFTGIYALDKVDLFNILCIPDATRAEPSDPTARDLSVDPNIIFGAALAYCKPRRAFVLIDAPPDVKDVDSAADWKSSGLTAHDENAAAYFPRLRLPDPLNNMQLRTFAPCGVIAGLYARIDAARGVWKAPAGTEAALAGVQGMVYQLTDPENGVLNPLGLNCLRIFPVYGAVSWGARTLVGADADANEWKYVPVRRMALFVEESLYRGTKWVVFEPNDEPLWSQIRLNIGAFMQDLFRQGAFQGKTPKEAYFVKCDSESTTQSDIDHGIVNIIVGFAPLKPAEFVVIQIQQIAGQIAT